MGGSSGKSGNSGFQFIEDPVAREPEINAITGLPTVASSRPPDIVPSGKASNPFFDGIFSGLHAMGQQQGTPAPHVNPLAQLTSDLNAFQPARPQLDISTYTPPTALTNSLSNAGSSSISKPLNTPFSKAPDSMFNATPNAVSSGTSNPLLQAFEQRSSTINQRDKNLSNTGFF